MSAAPRAVKPSINGWNAPYLDAEYRRFRADPSAVPDDLAAFFRGFELAGSGGAGVGTASSLQAHADALIAVYRGLGHMAAAIDPFGRERERPHALSLEHQGLGEGDLDRLVNAEAVGLSHETPLRQVVDHLEQTYCGSIGAEFMHVQNREEREWLQHWFEGRRGRVEADSTLRVHLLRQLLRAHEFERFIGKRYPGEKRFSLEGAESLIPLLDRVLEEATETGVVEVVLGMAHRGRLNVLNNILGKTYEQIFTEFEDNWEEDFVDGGGDVKYHRGYSGTRVFANGKKLHLAMASNPSHLEAVGPVVLGRCRAKQRLNADLERRRVIPVLVHGDAAIAGQGVVAESLNMSHLKGYCTGGCIRIVVNNMIGFTTSPVDARSSRYCTDVAKIIEAPILHVNGEHPEAMVTAARLAVEYRQTFRKDFFIDMYCYRRFGHNEQDEASFTQPLLVRLIKNKPSVLDTYAERLLADGVIDDTDMKSIVARLDGALERAQETAKVEPHDPTIDPGSARWRGLSLSHVHDPVETGVPMELLEEVCASLARVPEGFSVNRKLKKLLKERAELPKTKRISYADAESLAFGTLLAEGIPVRLSGQDSRRGTFSHRHAVLYDAETAEPYTPLNHVRELGVLGTDRAPGMIGDDGRPRQAKFCVYDSPLSEAAIVAFDYGYSLADPNMLVCWEAQFGDFWNGAQVIIDQFLASAAAKWQRWSGLVLLLPHGYEGAGPEHSSARIERFLQLCGDRNMQVVYPSTAAQTFHMFRRQVMQRFRTPLIVMTPKSLLRTPTGTIDELTRGHFHEVLDDPMFGESTSDAGAVSRVLICSGKIFYELTERREALGRTDIAIIRLEQLYPIDSETLGAVVGRYPASAERFWVQEEPRNMGAYAHTRDVVMRELGWAQLGYIGRDESGSPAVGSKAIHKIEQGWIMDNAVGLIPKDLA